MGARFPGFSEIFGRRTLAFRKILAGCLSMLGVAGLVVAQAPAPIAQQPRAPGNGPSAPGQTSERGGRGRGAPSGEGPPAGFNMPPAYPVRPPADPAVLDHGKQIFSVNCSFCHGADARGGETGPNLVRSEIVMDDKDGELIATVVQNGRLDRGMPKFDLSANDISAIAAFIHSFPVGGRTGPTGSVNPLVGDAKAGEAYFIGPGKCSTCHSVTGDLAGLGSKYRDVRTLQGAWLSGAGGGGGFMGPTGPPLTASVTMPSGQTLEGQLVRMDDFNVVLKSADGTRHDVPRNRDIPKVVVKNPLKPHLDMLRTLTDKDDVIHNVTAYLVTLK